MAFITNALFKIYSIGADEVEVGSHSARQTDGPQTQVNNGEEMDRCQGHACVVYSQSLNSKNLNTFVYII